MSIVRTRARRRAAVAGTAVAAVVLTLASATGAAADPPTPPTDDPLPVTACDTHLTEPGDYVVMNDLSCGSQRGIWIDASDVHLSLGGHTLSSSNQSVYIGGTAAGVSGVVVSGPGTITGAGYEALLVANATDSTITGITSTGNGRGFFSAFGTSSNITWSHLDAHDNGAFGLSLATGSGHKIIDSTFTDNNSVGILLSEYGDPTVSETLVSGNTVTGSAIGIQSGVSTDARIVGNTVTGNSTDLVEESCANRNVWSRNTYVTTNQGRTGGCIPTLPSVTSVDKKSGPTAGGDTLVITGTLFTAATRVAIGGVKAASYTVDSDTQITAVTPAHAAGSARVVVTNSDGRSTASKSVYTYQGVPAITKVSPAAGPVAGGNKVVLTGTRFTGATGVKFGNVAGSVVKVTGDTSITVIAPIAEGESAGPVTVKVTAPGGTSGQTSAATYKYVAVKPAITAISSTSGTTEGGQQVTLTGSGFLGATKVYVNGPATPASFKVVSDTEISLVTPARTSAGTVRFYVAGPGGTSNGQTYKYVAPAGPK